MKKSELKKIIREVICELSGGIFTSVDDILKADMKKVYKKEIETYGKPKAEIDKDIKQLKKIQLALKNKNVKLASKLISDLDVLIANSMFRDIDL